MRVQDAFPLGRAVPPENMHVTLAFLGDASPEALEDLHLELEQVRVARFELEIAELDSQGHRPAVVMAQVRSSDALVALQKQVARAARRTGFQLEARKFKPHVTLMRYGKAGPPVDGDHLARAMERFGALRLPPVTMTAFGLYRSTLTRDGAIYDLLAEYPLN